MKLLISICVVFCLFSGILSANIGNARILNGGDGIIPSYYVDVGYYRSITPTVEAAIKVGGTVITSRHVLTVASIIRSSIKWNVYYKTTTTTNGVTTTKTVTSTSSNAAYYEGYVNASNSGTRNHDIGIIYLTAVLPSTVGVATLPDKSVTLTTPNTATEILIYGKGSLTDEGAAQETIKFGSTRIVSYTLCTFTKFTYANFFCSKDAYTNICAGDIGAPATQVINSKITVVGIAAATGGCTPNAGSIYTNIYPYRKWIAAATNDGY